MYTCTFILTINILSKSILANTLNSRFFVLYTLFTMTIQRCYFTNYFVYLYYISSIYVLDVLRLRKLYGTDQQSTKKNLAAIATEN